MANTFRNDIYRPARPFSYIVMTLFGGIALCSAFYIVMSVITIAFPDARMQMANGSSVHVGIGLIGLAAILEGLLRILSIVFFLIWEYRSFNNLSALKARNLEFSPGWSVGWWFIPFANLVKPFQAIRELWNESDPDFDEEAVFHYAGGGTPEVVGFWWATFLISGIINNISNKMTDSAGNISDYFPVVMIVAGIFQMAAAILIIYIVKGVTKRQEQRFNKIAATQQFSPPPPDFYQNS